MQSLNVYHYPNLIEVRVDIDPTITVKGRIVYQRTIKIYSGVDNLIQILFKNSTQKPVNVAGWTINFNLISNSESVLLLRKPITVVGNTINGLTSVTLTSDDLLNLRHEFYNFGVTVTDSTGTEQVVYTDDNYGARSTIQLLEGPYPKFQPSIDVLLPTNSNTSIISSWVASDTPSVQQSAHHTAQFYFDNYTGNIAIQSTLDSLPPNGNTGGNTSLSWGTITTLNYINQNTTEYCNFDGIFTAVRFVCTPSNPSLSYMTGANVAINSDSVTQILYRG